MMRYLNFFSFLMVSHGKNTKNMLFFAVSREGLKFINLGTRIIIHLGVTVGWVGMIYAVGANQKLVQLPEFDHHMNVLTFMTSPKRCALPVFFW